VRQTVHSRLPTGYAAAGLKIKKQTAGNRFAACALRCVNAAKGAFFFPKKESVSEMRYKTHHRKNTAAQRDAAETAPEMPHDDFFAMPIAIPNISFLWYESGYTPFCACCQYEK
jgi:hypothetical protein